MKPGALIPSNVASLKSLTVTMAVMSYLACLAIGYISLAAIDGDPERFAKFPIYSGNRSDICIRSI